MGLKELKRKIKFMLILDGVKRAEWLRKNKILKGIGINCLWQSRKFPMDPECILIHDNVTIAADVTFVTHDAIRHVLGYMDNKYYVPNLGCIEVKNNVFIGLGSIIMPNVRINENVVVAAGSVVTKDVPANSVIAGVPARVIGNFNDLKDKRELLTEQYKNISKVELIDKLWKDFFSRRDEKIR